MGVTQEVDDDMIETGRSSAATRTANEQELLCRLSTLEDRINTLTHGTITTLEGRGGGALSAPATAVEAEIVVPEDDQEQGRDCEEYSHANNTGTITRKHQSGDPHHYMSVLENGSRTTNSNWKQRSVKVILCLTAILVMIGMLIPQDHNTTTPHYSTPTSSDDDAFEPPFGTYISLMPKTNVNTVLKILDPSTIQATPYHPPEDDDKIHHYTRMYVRLSSVGDVRPSEGSVKNIVLQVNNSPNLLSYQASTMEGIPWKNGLSNDWTIFSEKTTFMKQYGTLRPWQQTSSYADIYGDCEGIYKEIDVQEALQNIFKVDLSVDLKFGRGFDDPRRKYVFEVGRINGSERIPMASVTASVTMENPGNRDWLTYTATYADENHESSTITDTDPLVSIEQDSVFQIVPALFQEGDEPTAINLNPLFLERNKNFLVSLKTSAPGDDPPSFLRHANFQLRNHPYEDSSLYRLDASFYMKKEEFFHGEYYTFRSINYQHLYLAIESNMKVYMRQADDSEIHRQRASFCLTQWSPNQIKYTLSNFYDDDKHDEINKSAPKPEDTASVFNPDDPDHFIQVYGKGNLANSPGYNNDMNSYLWKCTEDNSSIKNPVFYVKRVCDSCPASHKQIVYKRLTPLPEGLNLQSLFLTTWSSEGNLLNTDFELYDSMLDALGGLKSKRWTFCNYNDKGIGFPRDCGPHGAVAFTWGSLSRGGQTDFAFYLYNDNPGLDTCTDDSNESSELFCDDDYSFVRDIPYSQISLTGGCFHDDNDNEICDANPVYGMPHNQTVAVDYCKHYCFTKMEECKGFFFQKHMNGHEICGFYTSDVKCSGRIYGGHKWRSVCLPTQCHSG